MIRGVVRAIVSRFTHQADLDLRVQAAGIRDQLAEDCARDCDG